MPVLQGPFGGNGGEGFNDLIDLDPAVILRSGIMIKEVNIKAGDYVDSIQVTYGFNNNATRSLDRRGGLGGPLSRITLEDDEVFVKVEGKINGQLIGQMIFTSRRTNGDERKHGPYGRTGNSIFYRRTSCGFQWTIQWCTQQPRCLQLCITNSGK